MRIDKEAIVGNYPMRCCVCGSDLLHKNIMSDGIGNWCYEHGFNPPRPYVKFQGSDLACH